MPTPAKRGKPKPPVGVVRDVPRAPVSPAPGVFEFDKYVRLTYPLDSQPFMRVEIRPDLVSEVSDGYHTFGELYEHRCLLFALLVRTAASVIDGSLVFAKPWRSHAHDDGSRLEGWFVAGLTLATGPITYHLPERMWHLLDTVPTFDRAPAFDGHTSGDVVQRLAQVLALWSAPVNPLPPPPAPPPKAPALLLTTPSDPEGSRANIF